MKGGGPGGQNVNKITNAVFLRHLPTGLWVKCHQQRSVEMNRKIARQLLGTKLDNFVNGEMSVEAQKARIEKEHNEKNKEKIRLKYLARAAAKKEKIETDGEVIPCAEPSELSDKQTPKNAAIKIRSKYAPNDEPVGR